MREKIITIPELALVAGTRFVLGAGVGLLLAGRMNDDQRQAAGWALLVVGVLSTIPIAAEVLGKDKPGSIEEPRAAVGRAESMKVPAHF
jgi:hypothetical protein